MKTYFIMVLMLVPFLMFGQAQDLPHANVFGVTSTGSFPNYVFRGTVASTEGYNINDMIAALPSGDVQMTFEKVQGNPHELYTYTVTAISVINGNEGSFTVTASNGTPATFVIPNTMQIQQTTPQSKLILTDESESLTSMTKKINHNFIILDGGGGGGNNTVSYTQNGHGFTMPAEGIVFMTYAAGGGLEPAKADALGNVPTWAAIDFPDANTITLATTGIVTLPNGHGLTVGRDYFLQNDGSKGLNDLSSVKLGAIMTVIDANSYSFDVPEVVFSSLTQGILEAGMSDTDQDTRIISTEGATDEIQTYVDGVDIMRTISTGVGIGGVPSSSSVLELTSTVSGFVPPRMTNTQMGAIPTPIKGMTVYSLDDNKNYTYDGSIWFSNEVGTGSVFPSALNNALHRLIGNAILADGIYVSNGTTWTIL